MSRELGSMLSVLGGDRQDPESRFGDFGQVSCTETQGRVGARLMKKAAGGENVHCRPVEQPRREEELIRWLQKSAGCALQGTARDQTEGLRQGMM